MCFGMRSSTPHTCMPRVTTEICECNHRKTAVLDGS